MMMFHVKQMKVLKAMRYKRIKIKDNNDKETDILQYYEGGYWYKDNMSKWHYERNSGYEAIGWFKYDGNWYYLGDDGIMKTGWVNIDNNWYYFYLDGKLAVSTTIDGYNLNENGEVY